MFFQIHVQGGVLGRNGLHAPNILMIIDMNLVMLIVAYAEQEVVTILFPKMEELYVKVGKF